MSGPNILLTRIDNRLVHGQVGVTWVNHLGANLLVVANDKVSEDEVQQNLMDMVLPDTIQARYFSLQKTIDVIHKASPRQKIFLVVKDVQDALKLKQGGVPIDVLNVGNMHYEEGKKQISSTVSVNEQDISDFKELDKLGV
ncbi:MAG TPA: PTS N-acetylgalactosamine transporter subunit IIB, partial [Pseudogracilibacillus sp.]|nr:PTS N-acetylgalactosamine transporter subunit IIB [Pseudogracilibacillus sp.]HLR43243.1 PTS N-acetylgalactosamine transporter subunit IIB [Pseudogracilibacillus sp.]